MSTLYSRVVNTSHNRNFKVNVESYNSAMEVVEHCRQREITDYRFIDMSEEHLSRSWEGVDSYDEALHYLNNGYQPTVDALNGAMKDIRSGVTKRMQFENNVFGFMPVVPLALMGVPNSMINMSIKPIKCKVIDIYYDIGVNAGVGPDEIIESGQKLLGAIMELEQKGYKFNLYAGQTYNDESSADVLVVKIKSSRNPIDLKRMSFPLTHTAFFRVIGFDWYSKTPRGVYRSGYGHDLKSEFSTHDEVNAFGKQVFGDNAIFIRCSDVIRNGKEYLKKELMANETKIKD